MQQNIEWLPAYCMPGLICFVLCPPPYQIRVPHPISSSSMDWERQLDRSHTYIFCEEKIGGYESDTLDVADIDMHTSKLYCHFTNTGAPPTFSPLFLFLLLLALRLTVLAINHKIRPYICIYIQLLSRPTQQDQVSHSIEGCSASPCLVVYAGWFHSSATCTDQIAWVPVALSCW